MTKQKEGKRPKAGEFNASNGWFNTFIKRFGLKNVKITGEAASANQETADKFPGAIKKSIEEKGYLPEQVLMQTKVLYSAGREMPQRIFISKEEKGAPRFKAGMHTLTLLFCANAVGFLINCPYL